MKRFTIQDYHILKPYIDISDYHEYNSNIATMLMWDFQYHVYYEVFEHFALVYTQEEGDVIEYTVGYYASGFLGTNVHEYHFGVKGAYLTYSIGYVTSL